MARRYLRSAVLLAAWTTITAALIAGCQMASQPGSTTAPAAASPWASRASEEGGAELWAETCAHCHNLRSPASYGPAQWEVAVYDMRVRAHLTGEEQRKILEFLKAASQ